MAIPMFATVLLVGILIYWTLQSPALVISEETTRITGPLTARGEIDFFKALEEKIYPPELATDDNGFRIFVRTFGDVGSTADNAEYGEFYRLQKYEKLGLDPNIPPTLTFPREPLTIIRDFCKAKGEEMPWRQINLDRPWTLEEYPMLADWIDGIDEPLDAIAEAIRKPIFMSPMYQSPESVESGIPQFFIDMLLPDVQTMRAMAKMFSARANYRIALGNIDGAIDDKLTIHRLGRQVMQKSLLVEHLVGISCEEIATAIPIGANPEHPLTEAQIRRLLAGLDALPPRFSLQDSFEIERYLALDAVQAIAEGREAFFRLLDRDEPSIFDWLFRLLPIDKNVAFRRVNEAYDFLQEPAPREKLRTMQETILKDSKPSESGRSILEDYSSASGRGKILADLIITLFVPNDVAAEETVHRSECADNMQRLALAILLYQLEHDEMPGENWAEQIQKYLGDGAFGEGAEQYFSCPANPAASGETTYALVQCADTTSGHVGGSLMLVELTESVPFDRAIVSIDETLELAADRRKVWQNAPHTSKMGGMNVVYRNGAVRYLHSSTTEEEWLRLLGRENEAQ